MSRRPPSKSEKVAPDDYDVYEEFIKRADFFSRFPLEFSMQFNAAMMEAQQLKMPEAPFTYTPLKGNEIRLMVLMEKGWSSYEKKDEIVCLLLNIDPRHIPQYECLSYVWGAPDEHPPRIWCNGKTHSVSSSLLSALHNLRNGFNGPRFLWIDQLCINQSDAVEKGKQVQRMAEIYENALWVLLFPGLDESLSTAIEFLFDFCEENIKDWKDESSDFHESWLTLTAEDLEWEQYVPLPSDERWAAVRQLLSAPIFRRTWVIQEAILGREVRIMVDEKEYHFDKDGSIGFAEFIGMHYRRNLAPVQGSYLGSEADDVQTLLRARTRHRHFPEHRARALLPLLCEMRDFRVTDSRDKIYGILSLASDTRELGIVPDYVASVAACYTDTARKLIARYQNLEILLCKETLRTMDNLPTWVPNWTCSSLEKFTNPIGKHEKMYSASKGLKLRLRDLKDDTRLGIQGIHIDTITSTTSGIVDDSLTGIFDDLFGHGLWWMRAHALIGAHYTHTNEPLAQALGRTRLGGAKVHADKTLEKVHGSMAQAYYEVREDEVPAEADAHFLRLMGTMGTMTCYRLLITTTEKYMGLAPLTAEIGDEIFVLPGAETPFVLRARQEECVYEVVGQCYLHGIMDGERADENKLRDIVLI